MSIKLEQNPGSADSWQNVYLEKARRWAVLLNKETSAGLAHLSLICIGTKGKTAGGSCLL